MSGSLISSILKLLINTTFFPFFFSSYERFAGSEDGKSSPTVTFKPGQRVTLA